MTLTSPVARATAVARRVAPLRRGWRWPRPEPRSWRLGHVVGTLVLVAVAVLGVQFRRAQVHLNARTAELAEATASLETASTDLDRTHTRLELTADTVDLVGSEIDLAVDARVWAEAVSRNTEARIATVDAARAQTDAALLLVAASSNETQACFDGVSQAVEANRAGHGSTVIEALNGAAVHCTRTLALTTGARFPYDFADPYVLRAGDAYFAYSTNAGAGDIQVIRSTDLVAWTIVGNGLAALPAWAMPDATWAPSVLARDGHYVMYYTVREAASWRQCISRAVAPSPSGPFLDDSTGPLLCQREHGGSIDPSPFVDGDGRAYLLWKSEGQGAGPSMLWSQELAADGLSLVGAPRSLLSADRWFERGTIEAPTMLHSGGRYFLLYAAAGWSSRDYSTVFATCAGPVGPCSKPTDGRILTSGSRIAGPGGAEVFHDRDGRPWVAFHAYSEPNVGYPSSRYLHIARLGVSGDRVTIDTGT